jgi:hypothetical protein
MDRCALVSANGGWNLLIGTLPEARGSFIALEGARVPAACRTVFGEADKDACFARAALQSIDANPWRWLTLVPLKLAATFDYTGAAGFYLHSSNAEAFSAGAKTALGIVELTWERALLALSLFAVARTPGARRRLRCAVAAFAGVWLILPAAWVAHLGLVLAVVLLGRRIVDELPAALAASAVATTAVTHAVFFGAGRYSLVCAALSAALAGMAFRAQTPRF